MLLRPIQASAQEECNAMPRQRKAKGKKAKKTTFEKNLTKQESGHTSLLATCIIEANKNRLFIMVEPATASRRKESWAIFCKDSGRLILNYHPDTRTWIAGSRRGESPTAFSAVRFAASLVRGSQSEEG